MKEHRPRLSDQDMSVVVSALRARLAMRSGTRRAELEHLIERLEDTDRGNPRWRFSWESPADASERYGDARPSL